MLRRPCRESDAWRERVFERVRAERPAVVVLGAARHYGPEYHFRVFGQEWLAGLRDTVRRLRATGARVVVLSPTPLPKRDIPECLSRHLDDAAACTRPLRDAVDPRGARAEAAAVRAAGGVYVDVTPWICTRSRCAVVVGNLLVYRDDNHLTTSYAAWLAPVLAAELDAAGRVRQRGRAPR